MRRYRGAVLRSITLVALALGLAIPTAWASPPDEPLFAIEGPAPSSVVVDVDGAVFVSDYSGDRVLKYAPDGTLLLQWGAPGTALGQFSGPFGLTLDGRGGVYVVDQINNRIQRFSTTDGTYLGAFGIGGAQLGQFRTPFGITWSGGLLFVADFGNDRVQVLRPDGTQPRAWGSRGNGPGQFTRTAGIAVDRDGLVYVSDHFNDRVQKFTPDGRLLGEIGGPPFPPVQATRGTLAIGLATATPAAVSEPLPDRQLVRPEGLAIDRDGNLLVADYGRHRVAKFSPEGRFLQAWGGGSTASGGVDMLGPKGVAVDPRSGALYVADTGNGRVLRLGVMDGTGAVEAVWALPPLTPGGTASGPGATLTPTPAPATPLGPNPVPAAVPVAPLTLTPAPTSSPSPVSGESAEMPL